jgi:ABC-type transporter Mla MlaB component
MKFTIDETGRRGVITADGPLTVRTIEEAKNLLQSSLQSIDELEFDVEGVTEVDLCGLQLGCSLMRTASKLGKKLVMAKSIPPVFSKAIEETGACFHSSCELSNDKCVWKRG